MKKSQMEVDFDKWLSGYTGTCSDNHALYQAFCAGYAAAQPRVQPTLLESGQIERSVCTCAQCQLVGSPLPQSG